MNKRLAMLGVVTLAACGGGGSSGGSGGGGGSGGSGQGHAYSLYVGTGIFGLYGSDDHGETLTLVDNLNASVDGFATVGGDTLLWTFSTDVTFPTLMRTSDGGVTYESVEPEYQVDEDTNAIFAAYDRHYVGAWGSVYRSDDAGDSWTRHTTGLPAGGTLRAFAVSGANLLVATTGLSAASGVWASTDQGDSFAPSSTGIPDVDNVIALYAGGGGVVFAAGSGGIYVSQDDGATWTPGDTVPLNATFAFFKVGSRLLIGTFVNGLLVSDDNGATIVQGCSEIAIDDEVHAFALDGTTLLIGASDGVYTSDDSGDTCTLISDIQSGVGDGTASISAIWVP